MTILYLFLFLIVWWGIGFLSLVLIFKIEEDTLTNRELLMSFFGFLVFVTLLYVFFDLIINEKFEDWKDKPLFKKKS